MRYARIDDGAAVEFVETDGDIAKMFHPSLQFVAASADAALGWVLDGDELVAPPPPPPPTKDELTAYAIDQRWRKEVGGIVVSGIPISTDDRSKQMILGARLAADLDPNWTTQWVAADGSVHPVDAAAIIAISDAVQTHVNACFVTYASIKTDIDAASITTTAEIDAAFAA